MEHSATYQTRVAEYVGIERKAGDAVLSAYGELYGRVERHLFAEVVAGRSAVSLKRAYLKRYGLPARMFNAGRVVPGRQDGVGQGAAETTDGQPGSAGGACRAPDQGCY